MSKPSDIVNKVRSQYEDLPYPKREPEDELTRLIRPFGATLDEINHFCFAGQESFDNIRILVAGAGTGDAVIHLGLELRDKPNAEIIYLDMSQSSMDIAKARAKIRGLDNISWHLGSLLDLPAMDIEPVDFINCAGVIHHLPDPIAGLQALTGVLNAGGSIFLMVYATYGRHAVYHAQDLFRDLLPDNLGHSDKVAIARRWLDVFPDVSFMKRNLHRWRDEISSDAGLLDLLLHSQDRSYTVDEIYELVEDCQLHFVDFTGPLRPAYNLEQLITDRGLLEPFIDCSKRERQSLAERIFCNIPMHSFFLSRQEKSLANIEDGSNKIVFSQLHPEIREQIYQAINPGNTLTLQLNVTAVGTLLLPTTALTKAIFSHLGQGLSNNQVVGRVSETLAGISPEAVWVEIKRVFTVLHEFNICYLQNADLPDYQTVTYTHSQ